MRWVAKAAVQGAISHVPRGHELNYYLQKHASKRLPRRGEAFDMHAVTAAQHLAALARIRPGADRSSLHFYEFGAGWDLIGPIAMWALGVDRQTLLDIRPNLKFELVNDTIRQFAARSEHLERLLGGPLRPVEDLPVTGVADLESRFGITYLAPADARSVPLPAGSVDFVSSTFTLEHIPAFEISAILRETRRLLGADGVMSSLIDMQDHYQYIDSKVSVYNFLRYRSPVWLLLNPSLQWQSRLRHSQYLELFRAAGYEILFDEPKPPTEEDLSMLAGMHVAPEFARFTLEDLGTRATHLVVRVARPQPRSSSPHAAALAAGSPHASS